MVAVWGKTVPGSIERLCGRMGDPLNRCAIRAPPLTFRHTRRSAWPKNPPALAQKWQPDIFWHEARDKTCMHQVKGALGKVERLEGIHNPKMSIVPSLRLS